MEVRVSSINKKLLGELVNNDEKQGKPHVLQEVKMQYATIFSIYENKNCSRRLLSYNKTIMIKQ